MKKALVVGSILASVILSSCSQRIGDLTMISNRNIEFEKKHVEIKRDVSATSTRIRILGIRLGSPNMEEAIDKSIRKQGTGEYLKNATVYQINYSFILFGWEGIKVKGDLMGYEGQKTAK